MAAAPKQSPAIAATGLGLAERFAALKTAGEEHAKLRVQLTVRGGLPEQAYRLEFDAHGDGRARARYECRMRNRSAESGAVALPAKQFRAVFGKVTAVLAMPEESPTFLPDTLVGLLEISDGATVRHFYYAADEEQARTQQKVPPPPLKQLIDAIYAAAASLTKERSVKP